MCVKNLVHQNYYTEAGIATVDILVFILSLYATIKHFKDSGGHFTDVTYFHIIHASYCVSYGLYHYLMIEFVKCACDPWNYLFVFYIAFYVLSWERFLRHWKKSTKKHGAPQEKWKLRSFIYSLVVAGFAVVYTRALMSEPCDKAKFYYYGGQDVWFVAFPALFIVTIDSSILAYACICRLKEFQEKFPGNNQVAEAQRQVAMFISIPLCMCLAGIDGAVYPIPYISPEVFVFLIPSVAMLILMWKRNYIVISENIQLRESLKSETTPTFTANYLPLNYAHPGEALYHNQHCQLTLPSKLNDDLRVALLNTEEMEKESVEIDSKYRRMLNEELVFVPKLTSHITIEQASDDNSSIIFEEQLHPCPMTTSLVLEYLANIILPLVEGMYEEHLNQTRTLMRAANPDNNNPISVFGNCEMESQFEELSMKYDDLTHEYLDFLQMTRVVVDTLPTRIDEYLTDIAKKSTSGKGGVRSQDTVLPLKRSQLKASKVLAHMAINLNVHSTFIQHQSESQSRSKGRGGSVKLVRSVTMGAPASHALGWKHTGGLKDTIHKLEEMKLLKKKQPAQFTHPEDMFQLMQLSYLTLSHGSIVFSEAICALVSASVVTLTECLVNNELDILKQYGSIGLLVHSASLLSTAGKEECMLNDFIGAYETLNVSLTFEYGKRLSRYSSSSHTTASDSPDNDDDGQDVDANIMEISYIHESASKSSSSKDSKNISVSFVKRMANITVVLRVFNEKAFSKLSQLSIHSIQLVPVLFNLGVNEAQSVANLSGSTLSQAQINRLGVSLLKNYYESFFLFWDTLRRNKAHEYSLTVGSKQDDDSAMNKPLPSHGNEHKINKEEATETNSVVQSGIFGLHELPFQLEVLHHEIETEVTAKAKNVNMLLLSCFIARSMNGARTTSCKSAKDRTSVFQTLEMVKLARHWGFFNSKHHIDDDDDKETTPSSSSNTHERLPHHHQKRENSRSSGDLESTSLKHPLAKKEQEALDRLRGLEGVRLNNCRLNIGRAFYSFNQLQLRALPFELRPPASTATGGKS